MIIASILTRLRPVQRACSSFMADSRTMNTGPGCWQLAVRSASFGQLRHAVILLLLASIFVSGCTNLKPVAMDPETLQENIRDGKVVHEGDTIRVVTRDGVSHLLVVSGVDEHILRGHATGAPPGAVVIEIPIDDVIVLEEEKVNVGESATGSVGVITVLFVAAVIIAPVAVLSALL